VEFIYDRDCPNVLAAPANLIKAFATSSREARWTEWDSSAADSPPHIMGYGSPTVLVEGKDVAEHSTSGAGVSCRLGFLLDETWVLALTTAFLGLAVGALAFRARLRRNYGPFLFGLAASVVVLAGKFAFGSNAATYGGLAALIAAAVWNAWSPRGRLAGSSSVCSLFKWRQFEPEVILLAVGWYLPFSLSYRDVEELLAERGVEVDHVSVYRWVQRFTPLLADAARPCRHLVGDR
jgi:hypothetical protein